MGVLHDAETEMEKVVRKWRVKDVVERTVATAVEAGLAYAATALAGVDAAWAVPVATVLAYAKSQLAKMVGWDGDASMVSFK
jgi:hypothetical protein